jgi:3-oxoadipate enol-lactonase
MAQDAIEFISKLHVERVHVFGISLGGMVASWFAIDAPERVASLVLASTLPSMRTVSRRILNEIARLGRSLLTPHFSAEAALVHAVLSPEFCHEHADRVAAIDHALRTHPAKLRNLASLAFAAARHDAGTCLTQIRATTLLLLGSRDPIAGLTSQRELATILPHATLEVIPGSGHDITLEQPETSAARVVSFCERTSNSHGA